MNRFLISRYLDNAKDSLVTNVTGILLKYLLRKNNPVLVGHEQAAHMALLAVSVRHPHLYRTTVRDLLRRLAPGIEDLEPSESPELVGVDPRLWEMLDEPTHIKCKQFVESYSPHSIPDDALISALSIEPLRGPLMERLSELDDAELHVLVERCPRPELSEMAIAHFAKSGTFRTAEARGKVALYRYGKYLTVPQIRQVLKAIPANNQIWDASNIPPIVSTFFRIVKPHLDSLKDDWEQMMRGVMENEVRERDSEGSRRAWDVLLEPMTASGLGPFEWPVNKRAAER